MVSSRKDLKLLRNPFWPLRHPRLAASATGSARRRSPARACRGQILSNKKETVTKTVTVSFWQGQKDLVSPAGSVGASAYGRGVHRTPAPLRIGVDKKNLFTGVMKSNFEIQCRSWFPRASFLIFDCNYFAVHNIYLLYFVVVKNTAMYGMQGRKVYKPCRQLIGEV